MTRFKRILLITGLSFVMVACTNVFLYPMKQHIASPAQYGLEFEDVFIKSADQPELHGWWFPAKGPAKASVMFLHGNAENISTHAGLIHWLTRYQYDVFIFDYRGYGKSAGKADVEGAIADISVARKYILDRIQQQQPLYVIGHSLGASMGIYSLAKDATGVDGAIFVSPFSEYPKVAKEMIANTALGWLLQWPAYLIVSGEYNPLEVVDQLGDLPKLFIYSEDDSVIAPEHVIELYERATVPKHLESVGGSHNSLFSFSQNQQLILEYLGRWHPEPTGLSVAP